MRHGTQGYIAAPRRSAQSLPGAFYISTIYLLLLYSINGFSAFRIPEGYSTHKIVGSYKPDDSLSFIPCGTHPHCFYNVGDVARRGVTNQTGDRSTRVDRMRRGPPTISQARAI